MAYSVAPWSGMNKKRANGKKDRSNKKKRSNKTHTESQFQVYNMKLNARAHSMKFIFHWLKFINIKGTTIHRP